uniref:uncharacterized protein LOC122579440 n=1 Tax=Erigeron canadensis TaxID=72917 RepID=UPI001CB9257D|nr:uncharacterized protein LOC122579440 [Erigeron canadensis]XP_043607552.1 uncharacterized protein LOC122579440 [Erigeron canadensis]XP_043607553.1 uncharacterized protein LOC122579440 [Erigeron canadensis]
MAEEDTKDEQPITKPEIISPYPNTTTFISWEAIHLPSSFPTQSPILLSSASSDPTPLHTWSSTPPPVNPLVFPPNNHENLTFDQHHQEKKVKPKTVSFDLTAKSDVKPAPGSVFELSPWWVLFQFKLPVIVGNIFKFFVVKRRVFWSFGFPVLMVLLYLRRRRRRRRESVDELLGVIKEKDERIRCLLYQIARMNELLLATHHGVPPMIPKAATSS